MSKKILYIDLDGVVADFDKTIKTYCPDSDNLDLSSDAWSKKVGEICKDNPNIFNELDPIDGAIEAVYKLFDLFDVYFLSTAMWDVPLSFTGKRLWIEKYFGEAGKKRLILTHRKDLNIGHFLVDDRLKYGTSEFTGVHIHFGTKQFPDWKSTLDYLMKSS